MKFRKKKTKTNKPSFGTFTSPTSSTASDVFIFFFLTKWQRKENQKKKKRRVLKIGQKKQNKRIKKRKEGVAHPLRSDDGKKKKTRYKLGKESRFR